MAGIPASVSKEIIVERLKSWSPKEGKPFDWLPDHTIGGGMIWYKFLPKEIKDYVSETAWWYAEMRLCLHDIKCL